MKILSIVFLSIPLSNYCLNETVTPVTEAIKQHLARHLTDDGQNFYELRDEWLRFIPAKSKVRQYCKSHNTIDCETIVSYLATLDRVLKEYNPKEIIPADDMHYSKNEKRIEFNEAANNIIEKVALNDADKDEERILLRKAVENAQDILFYLRAQQSYV